MGYSSNVHVRTSPSARDRTRAIPWPIAFELAFLDEDLTPDDWEREVRSVVRRHLHGFGTRLDAPGPVEEFDDRVWRIIREVIAEA